MKASTSETERLETIKSLLLDDELQEIERLRKRLRKYEKGDKERIKKNLSLALRELSDDDENVFHELTEALQPGTEAAIARSVVEDKSRMSRALFPVMGPAIRDYVSEMFRNLAEELNESIRNTTSLERIKWRFQARMAGKPFAEYVMLKTANYKVERLLLIDRESGILVDQVSRDDEEGNADLMSGMLTAIRSFVRDSFADHTDPDKVNELNRFSYGDHQVLIEGGPDMILAAVVEGVAPATLREKLQEVLENIHHRKNPWVGEAKKEGKELNEKEVYDRKELMRPALIENRSDSQNAGGGLWRFWVLCGIIAAILGAWIAYKYTRAYAWSEYMAALDKEPGIQVTAHQSWREVHGLKDPLAADPAEIGEIFKVDRDEVDFEFEPFQSLDPVILAKRGTSDITRIQTGLAAAQSELARQKKEFQEKLEEAAARQRKLAGEVIASRFGHLEGIQWDFEGDELIVSGKAPYPEFKQILDLPQQLPSFGKVDTSALKNSNEERIEKLIGKMKNSPLVYDSGQVLPKDAVAGISALAAGIKELRNEGSAIGREYRFTVTAHPLIGDRSDANRLLIQARAEAVMNRLVLNGIDRNDLDVEISTHEDQAGSGVTIIPELVSD